MEIRLAHLEITSGVNGPGRRLTLWVQGCPRRCPGCFNPAMTRPDGGEAVPVEDLAARALGLGPWDGITLSGGEPFDQAAGLAELLDLLGERRGAAPEVIAFTGYTVEELRRGSPEQTALLGRVDLLVDGPFRADLPTDRPLRGSGNQRLVALTPRGADLARRVEAERHRSFLVSIAPDGQVILSGFPPPGLARDLAARLGSGGAEG